MKTADFDGMYTGCDYDAETGLTYHWNRWRSEDGSCFISEDPARDGANWYGYAGCNPMVYVDRIGLFYYTGNVQQSSNNTNQAGTESAEIPSGMPQNQTPNITGPTGMPEGFLLTYLLQMTICRGKELTKMKQKILHMMF